MARPRPARLLRLAVRRAARPRPPRGDCLAAALPDRRLRRPTSRGAVQGQPAEGPVHRGDPPRPRGPADGRAVHRVSTRSTSSCCARRSWSCATAAGRSIFSTHQMEAAEALCESVAIVDHGRLVAGGTVRDLKRASGRRTIRLTVQRWRAGVARDDRRGRRCPTGGRWRRARARRRRRPERDPGGDRRARGGASPGSTSSSRVSRRSSSSTSGGRPTTTRSSAPDIVAPSLPAGGLA